MKFYRLYAGTDGQSHFEPLDTSLASELFNTTHNAKGHTARRTIGCART